MQIVHLTQYSYSYPIQVILRVSQCECLSIINKHSTEPEMLQEHETKSFLHVEDYDIQFVKLHDLNKYMMYAGKFT